MNTAFQNQGCQMDLQMGDGAEVPISALTVFNCAAILIFVPLFDGYVYPKLKSLGYGCTMLQKIGFGLFVTSLAMIVAAIVEEARLATAPSPGNYYDDSARDNITPCQNIDDYNPYDYQKWLAGIDDTSEPLYCYQTCNIYYDSGGVMLLNMTCINCNDIPQMSKLSIFWQIPQFTLVGISEILKWSTGADCISSLTSNIAISITSCLPRKYSFLG